MFVGHVQALEMGVNLKLDCEIDGSDISQLCEE
jgi:hypothetical protein